MVASRTTLTNRRNKACIPTRFSQCLNIWILKPSLGLRNLMPDVFNWMYTGSLKNIMCKIYSTPKDVVPDIPQSNERRSGMAICQLISPGFLSLPLKTGSSHRCMAIISGHLSHIRSACTKD